MVENTKISWTDHTFNPWWGCTKVAPGCDNCYAAELDKRVGGNYWIHANAITAEKPRLTSDQNWQKPVKWNEQAKARGTRLKVFCGSMMDWCDKNAPEGALERLWDLIRSTPMLDWQLLTKRASLIRKRLPRDWGSGYHNVWLGVTVENSEFGIERVCRLRGIPAVVRFLSCEPLIGEVDLQGCSNIDWVIIGGESGYGCRPMKQEWVTKVIDDCNELEIPVWFKQWGGNSRDKGGHEIDGASMQNWPSTIKARIARYELP